MLEQLHHSSAAELTFAHPDEILGMLRELCPYPADGCLPVWIRNLAYRLVLLQRPDDPALMREAASSLRLHGPDWDHTAGDLERRADALEIARPAVQADDYC
ncbi:hypothetical protein [Kitasatospora sp. NPDC057223]|uniref:hypothetical protein n=1 Tax=Kitasatospora sp. NPDC057223 TaxID=3346055 RepID=UPI00362BF53B